MLVNCAISFNVNVKVPWINFSTSVNVNSDNCSTMAVLSDGWDYRVLSCELTLPSQQEEKEDLFLLTLYLGKDSIGEVDVVGGVTSHKGWIPGWVATWLDKEGGGLVERWRILF